MQEQEINIGYPASNSLSEHEFNQENSDLIFLHRHVISYVILHCQTVIIVGLDPIFAALFLARHQVTAQKVSRGFGSQADTVCNLGTLALGVGSFYSNNWVLQWQHRRSNPNYYFEEVVDHSLAAVVVIVGSSMAGLLLRSRNQSCYSELGSPYALDRQALETALAELGRWTGSYH